MVAAVDNNDDIGFDIKRARLRLVAWLVRHGVVDPEVQELASAHRILFRAKNQALSVVAAEAIDESVAFAIMNAHDKRHRGRGRTLAALTAEDPRRCMAAPCKTHAASHVLARLHEYETEQAGPRARLAQALEAVLNDLMRGRHVRNVLVSMRAIAERMQRAHDEIQKHPAAPRVIIGTSPLSLSIPALTRSCVALSEVVSPEHQPRELHALVQRERSDDIAYNTVSPHDVFFAVEHAPRVFAIAEHLLGAAELSGEVLRDLLPTLPGRRPPKGRGRPKCHPLLKRVRHRLRIGGFSPSEIADLIPDRPVEGPSRREDAAQRVKHTIRAVSGSKRGLHNDR